MRYLLPVGAGLATSGILQLHFGGGYSRDFLIASAVAFMNWIAGHIFGALR